MEFPNALVPATLVRRYKRFLADATLSSGAMVTVHCPNPGAMTGLAEPGSRIWLEPNDDPKKKLKFGWRLNELGEGHWAGIDTGVPNKAVAEALSQKAISEVADYRTIKAEVPYGDRSRVDFLLSDGTGLDAYLEVKNVHLCREGDLAEFPDSVTKRGTKHLNELAKVAESGHRAIMLYFVQRTDCRRLALAADIDAAYAEASLAAKKSGVEILAYGANISTTGVTIGDAIAVEL